MRLTRETAERAEKMSFDPTHPETLRLRHLLGSPILQWPPSRPLHDPRGVASAVSFTCWKKASASRVGIAGSYFSHKAGGRTACHSFLEAKLLRYFEMCPFVVEIRTQYPAWNRADFLKYCEKGKRMPRNKIMTVDFMLTLRIPGYPFALYHGVSGKPSSLLEEEPVIARHRREANSLNEWGSTHEPMTENTVTNVECINYRRMLSYMLHTDDIGRHAVVAADLARALKATNAHGSLDRVLCMVARRLGWDRRLGYRLFGIANFLGYLSWNHQYELHPRYPMKLGE